MDFSTASATIKNRESKKVGNNTYLVRISPETIGVRLHNTIVVKIHKDGTYTLNSGGWRTVTTKDRINSYCPVRVSQNKYDWYVGDENVPFYDGIVVKIHHGLGVAE
jgi:hypothetical protein